MDGNVKHVFDNYVESARGADTATREECGDLFSFRMGLLETDRSRAILELHTSFAYPLQKLVKVLIYDYE